MNDVAKTNLSGFQDEPDPGDEPKPKVAGRAKRTLVLDENGEPMDKGWLPVPYWVGSRLAAIRASKSAYSLVFALGRLIRQRGGENPTSLYERDPETLACVPRGHNRTLALKQCEEAGVAKKVGLPDGQAPIALAFWLPRKPP